MTLFSWPLGMIVIQWASALVASVPRLLPGYFLYVRVYRFTAACVRMAIICFSTGLSLLSSPLPSPLLSSPRWCKLCGARTARCSPCDAGPVLPAVRWQLRGAGARGQQQRSDGGHGQPLLAQRTPLAPLGRVHVSSARTIEEPFGSSCEKIHARSREMHGEARSRRPRFERGRSLGARSPGPAGRCSRSRRQRLTGREATRRPTALLACCEAGRAL